MSDPHRSCHHEVYYLSCQVYDALWERAGGRCEVCRATPDEVPAGRLFIDHDRAVGDGWNGVRGIVCAKCNSGLRYVDSGFREPSETQRRYLAASWYFTHGLPERYAYFASRRTLKRAARQAAS